MNATGKMTVRSLLIWTVASSAAVSVCASIAAFALSKKVFAVSIAAGSLVAIASFAVLVASISQSMCRKTKLGLVFGILGAAKLAVIGLVLWWLITRTYVEPVSFLAGFSIVPAVLLLQSMRISCKKITTESRKTGNTE